jgi:hypothetical protein
MSIGVPQRWPSFVDEVRNNRRRVKKKKNVSLVWSGFVRNVAICFRGERCHRIRHSLGCRRPGRS